MAIRLLSNLLFANPARREISVLTRSISDMRWILRGCISSAVLAVSLCSAACAQKVYAEDFFNSTFTPETAWQPAITAAFSNWITQPTGFGAGWRGYGYHYGIAVSDNVDGKFMRKFAFASLSRHEDKFEPITTGGKWRRVGLAPRTFCNCLIKLRIKNLQLVRSSRIPSVSFPCLTPISLPNNDPSPPLSLALVRTAPATPAAMCGVNSSKSQPPIASGTAFSPIANAKRVATRLKRLTRFPKVFTGSTH